jgi:hypothetical protein
MTTAHWKQRELLRSEDTFATTLFLLIADKFGIECFEWLPTSLAMECEDTWQVQVPQKNIGKMMAAISIATSNLFYVSVPSFVNTCNALYGYADFESFDPADSEEIMMGITEALLIWPPDDPTKSFSSEIQTYIKSVLQSEGNESPAGILRSILGKEAIGTFASDMADDPTMFSAVYESQQGRHNALQESYYASVRQLSEELRGLPLQNGKTDEVIAQLERVVEMTQSS